MPQSIAIGDVVEVTMNSQYYEQTVQNVFHYVLEGTAIPLANGELELFHLIVEFQNKVWNAGVGALRTALVSAFTVMDVKAQVVNPTRKYFVSQVLNDPQGFIEEDGCPPDVHIAVDLVTDRALRGATGNKKFTGLPKSGMFQAIWDQVSYDKIFNFADNLLLTLNNLANTPVWRPLVWSHVRPNDRSTIIRSQVRQEIRVLRRRQKGIGI